MEPTLVSLVTLLGTTCCPGSEGVLETAEKGVYLSSLGKQHSVIHMLLINASNCKAIACRNDLQPNATI
eukprot:gene29176-36181_t